MGKVVKQPQKLKKTIEINNTKLECMVSFSKRKTIAIKIEENGQINIYVPVGIDMDYIDKVIQSKESWIWSNYHRILENNRAGIADCSKTELQNGSILKFKGKEYNLQIFKLGRKNQIYFDGDFIIVCVKDLNNQEEIINLVENFYREYARKVFTEKVEKFAEKMQVTYGRISIKEQKTRWGSCSSKGNLNFNWKVVKAPEYVIDYLVVHELSHRIEMNHSKAFWKVVKDTLPEYEAGKNWLKEKGKSLI